MWEKLVDALTKVDVVVGIGGLVSLVLGFTSPPSINPFPASHPYLRGIGCLLIGLASFLEARDRRIFLRYDWVLLVAGTGLGILLGLLPISSTMPDQPGANASLQSTVSALLPTIQSLTAPSPESPQERQQATEPPSQPSNPPPTIPAPSGPETVPMSPPDAVLIPDGSFLMGTDSLGGARAPAPQHPETVSAYWIGIHEVTNQEYEDCVAAGSCTPPFRTYSPTYPQYYLNSQFASYPVIYVSFNQAREYCLCVGGDLPSEQEWERAARGLAGATYPWGEQPPAGGAANLAVPRQTTDAAAVGTFPADRSSDGVYDLAGNVSEWTLSWYKSYAGNPSPFNSTDSLRVVRGANFRTDPALNYAKSYFRVAMDPEAQEPTIGFRCVWEAE